MDNKKLIKGFCIGVLIVTIIVLLLAIFYSSAFIPSFMLMLALFLFGICYYVKNDKKSMMYGLFIMGVLLVIGSLVYVYLRFK